MYNYYIINHRNLPVKITEDKVFEEFLIPEEDIAEHLRSQILYFRKSNPKHKIQPITIGISGDKFNLIVIHLSEKYKGFLANTFLAKGFISIKVQPKGSEIIRIVNENMIKEETND